MEAHGGGRREPAPSTSRYQILDRDSGAVTDVDECPRCEVTLAYMEEQIQGLEREARNYRAKIKRLESDKDREMFESPLRPQAETIHAIHAVGTGRRRKLDSADYAAIYSVLRTLGFETAVRAVAGAIYEPFTKRMRNGKIKRYDTIGVIYRTADKAADFAERAPAGWEPDYQQIAEISETPLADIESWLEDTEGRKRGR